MHTAERERIHELEALCEGRRIIVVANREPYSHEYTASGGIFVRHSSSGVVNAVEPLVSACGGVWVAHGSGSADREAAETSDGLAVPPEGPAYRLRRVWLSDEEQQGYYRGFSNEALWPLCHRAHVRPTFRAGDFAAYSRANARFADAVAEEAGGGAPLVLVQDYHFALAPRLIADRVPGATVCTFWHIPWPDWQTFEICPWSRCLLEGLLGSHLVGFQTPTDRENFLATVAHAFDARVDSGGVELRGHRTAVGVYPASIPWAAGAADPASRRSARESILRALDLDEDILIGVGVDRFDYTKGLEEKFAAVGRLLELHPELVRRFVFVQLAEPTRRGIPAYEDLRSRVLSAARCINLRFGRVDYCPIVLLEARHPPEDVDRFLRAADLCFVGSLHDGMNLVAKEFVRASDDGHGVLVLSAFAGAAHDLADALIVNPYDVDGTAAALHIALTMRPVEQAARMRRLRRVVARFDARRWALAMVADAIAASRGASDDDALADGVQDDLGGVVEAELLHQIGAVGLHG